MKTNKLLNFAFIGLLISFMFLGCTEDFEELNTNDRVLTELDAATIGNIFGRVQYRGYFMNYHQTAQNLFADHYCQYFANTQNAFSSDRYVLVGGWLNGAWRAFYGNVPNNLGEVLEATDPVENPGFEAMHAVAQIWRVIIYERIANYWGPIPYSQVNNVEASVPYDDEETMYKSFFTTLDAAIAALAPLSGSATNVFGENDQIYYDNDLKGGNVDSWIKFTNTLRLRLALRISDVEPGLAQSEAEKAVAAGVMETLDDNAEFQNTANSPHNMPRMIGWNEFRMSSAMESVLTGYDDPRVAAFFSPAVDPEFGEWRGLRNGYEIVDLAAPELFYDKLSRIGPKWVPITQQDVITWEILMAPEAYFCRAEGALKGWNMGGTAEELYNSGIEMSMLYWGIDPALIGPYQQSANVPVGTHDSPNAPAGFLGVGDPVSTIPVKFDAGDAAVAREQILTQKWLGLYPDGWEAWADQRRADLPKRYPIMASENADVGVNDVMRRVQFVSSEYEQNADAVSGALGKLSGPDKGSTRLWWDPAK
ncbi:MAG: SusD/RagB family nutrient-binding outer membrane lipoprotein [Bacteroidales bacterium]